MMRRRRGDARKVAKLVRALATLDQQARTVRPEPKRGSRVSVSA